MSSWRISAIAVLGLLFLPAHTPSAAAQEQEGAVRETSQGNVLRLREGAPTEYIVKKGDTLWDISALFLNDPWLWPELWRVNEDIANPHLIYPGDKLYLVWRNGQPQLVRKQQKTLLPEGEVAVKRDPLRMFPRPLLDPYIDEHLVVSPTELKTLPIVLGDNRGAPRINGMAPVFIDGDLEVGASYRVFTPTTHFEQGVLLRHVADLTVELDHSEMVEGTVQSPQREIRRGDVVLPMTESMIPSLIEAQPGADLDGYLLASFNERKQQGLYDLVVLSIGANDGVVPGQMYRALRRGISVFRDGDQPEAVNVYKPTHDLSRLWRETSQLPPAVTAEMMVVATQANTSFAIVVRSREWLQVGDYFVPVKW